ncbi:MAG: hypothetical protein DRO01_07015, partial [Thermoproteota archaeon]
VFVVTVDDDLTHATIAERARKMNPRLRIVVRTFRSEVGELLRSGDAADVTLSTSEISSPLSEGEVILVQDLSLSGAGSRRELGLGEGA